MAGPVSAIALNFGVPACWVGVDDRNKAGPSREKALEIDRTVVELLRGAFRNR